MDKGSAKKLIRETFERSFKRDRFIYFVKNLLNKIDESGSTVLKGSHLLDSYKPHIESLEYVGSYEDAEGSGLDVLIVQLKKETSLERARSMQRNLISWYLSGGRSGALRDASLVAFVSPSESEWRFSFVKMDYSLVGGNEGRLRVEEELTPSRRYSYLVGKNEKSHTAQVQLLPLLENDEQGSSLAQIEEAFNIESVTKEFFKNYRDLFFKIKDSMGSKLKAGSVDEHEVDRFAKNFLGQITFLYFLQKKGWLGVNSDAEWGSGPKNFIRLLFSGKFKEYKFFHTEILSPLLYKALAKERASDYYADLKCRIPFLGGSIFSSSGEKFLSYSDISISNIQFSNSIKSPEGDVGTGIFDVFDRYNFTAKEDDPLEKDVAIDPELLGKVFEELVSEQEGSGAYHTKEKTINFMCGHGLSEYLKNSTDLPEGIVDSFQEVPTNLKISENQKEELLSAIKKIRFIDPACGSGGYLVSFLNRLTRLTVDIGGLNNKFDPNYRNSIEIEYLKNNIFGVDSDSSAVDLARLNICLSISINSTYPTKLPNLDYVIRCGDSLLGNCTVRKNDNQELFCNLALKHKKLRSEYFSNNSDDVSDLVEKLSSVEKNIRKIQGLSDRNGIIEWVSSFPDVFVLNSGFDIVITSPPFIRHERVDSIEKDNLAALYKDATTRRSDYYCYFFPRGIDLLKDGGIAVLLSSNSWLDTEYGLKLQKYLLEKSYIKAIFDSTNRFQFTSTGINATATLIHKTLPVNDDITKFVLLKGDIESALIDANLRREVDLTQKQLLGAGDKNNKAANAHLGGKWGGLYLRAPDVFVNFIHGSDKFLKLGDVADVKFGIKTGANEFFYLRPKEKDAVKKFSLNNKEDGHKIKLYNKAGWEGEIEACYLAPILTSPKDLKNLIPRLEDCKYFAFICPKSMGYLRKHNHNYALRYIEWGRRKGYHSRRTCQGRSLWWNLGSRTSPDIVWPMTHNDRLLIGMGNERILVDHNLFEITVNNIDPIIVAASLVCSYQYIVRELVGRVNLGGGALKTEGVDIKKLLIINPDKVSVKQRENFISAFNIISKREAGGINEEFGLRKSSKDTPVFGNNFRGISSDRLALDNVVFDLLNFDDSKKNDLYKSSLELINNRCNRKSKN